MTVDELIKGVNIALGTTSVDACPSFDANGDGAVTINELIAAVNRALTGCVGVAATSTRDLIPRPYIRSVVTIHVPQGRRPQALQRITKTRKSDSTKSESLKPEATSGRIRPGP